MTPRQFDVERVRRRDGTTLRCRGRLVVDHGAQVFRETARRELSRARTLALDLGAITQIDASGVGVLAELWGGAQARGCALVLVGASHRVRHLLRLSRLDLLTRAVRRPCENRGNPALSCEVLAGWLPEPPET